MIVIVPGIAAQRADFAGIENRVADALPCQGGSGGIGGIALSNSVKGDLCATFE